MGMFDAVGSILNPVASIYNTNKTNQANKDMANAQMQFQANESASSHQREVADLKAAGLNPILSAGGNGASTPSGAMATMQSPDIHFPDFTDIMRLNQEQQKIDIAKNVAAADIPKKQSETALKGAQAKLAQKGIIRANVEGKAAQGLDWLWQRAKEKYQELTKPTIQATPSSSGGELP